MLHTPLNADGRTSTAVSNQSRPDRPRRRCDQPQRGHRARPLTGHQPGRGRAAHGRRAHRSGGRLHGHLAARFQCPIHDRDGDQDAVYRLRVRRKIRPLPQRRSSPKPFRAKPVFFSTLLVYGHCWPGPMHWPSQGFPGRHVPQQRGLLGGQQGVGGGVTLSQRQIFLLPRSYPSTERSKQGPQVPGLPQGQMLSQLPSGAG
jgi:hypothetical protein